MEFFIHQKTADGYEIRNLLTPMLTLANMVLADMDAEFTKPTAEQVKTNVAKIMEIIDK